MTIHAHAIETHLNKYSTTVLSDITQYGVRCAATAVAETLRSRGLLVSARDVSEVMAETILLPAACYDAPSDHAVELCLSEAV